MTRAAPFALALLIAAPAARAADPIGLAELLTDERLHQLRAVLSGDANTIRSTLQSSDTGSPRDPGWHFRRGVSAWMFQDRKAALDAFNEGLTWAVAPVQRLTPKEQTELFAKRAEVLKTLDAGVFPTPDRRTDRFQRFTTGVLEAKALPAVRAAVAGEAARAGGSRASWMSGVADGFTVRGVLFLEQKDVPKAMKDFRSAVQYHPGHCRAQTFLGLAQAAWGDYPRAVEALVRAAGCPEDSYPGVPLSLAAYVVATCPDADVRVKHRANALVWAEHGLKGVSADVLHLPPLGRGRHRVLARMAYAAALADNGQLDKAVRLMRDTPTGPEEDERVQRRAASQLAAYESGKPYREYKWLAAPTPPSASTAARQRLRYGLAAAGIG